MQGQWWEQQEPGSALALPVQQHRVGAGAGVRMRESAGARRPRLMAIARISLIMVLEKY